MGGAGEIVTQPARRCRGPCRRHSPLTTDCSSVARGAISVRNTVSICVRAALAPSKRQGCRHPNGRCRVLAVYGLACPCLPRERLNCMGEEMSVTQGAKKGKHFTRKSCSELSRRGHTVRLEKQKRWLGLMPSSDETNSGRMGTLGTARGSFERGTR